MNTQASLLFKSKNRTVKSVILHGLLLGGCRFPHTELAMVPKSIKYLVHHNQYMINYRACSPNSRIKNNEANSLKSSCVLTSLKQKIIFKNNKNVYGEKNLVLHSQSTKFCHHYINTFDQVSTIYLYSVQGITLCTHIFNISCELSHLYTQQTMMLLHSFFFC